MRLFFAFDIPESVRKSLWEFSSENLKSRNSTLVAKENIHVTLKFLGDVAEKNLQLLKDPAEKTASSVICFKARLGLYCILGNKVGCVGIAEGKESFMRVFDKLEEELGEAGIEKDKRRYFPHVTLARFKGKPDQMKFRELTDDVFEINSFVLYSSVLTPGGAVYKELDRFFLKGD
ncbi:RNA 2',3'-cyclic phosphodiesterase [candidate division WOR-3 bacterium]|nr:RNA 2',3'-cyclic phosphodiesterase [candidate division WOR-3 bacterium]